MLAVDAACAPTAGTGRTARPPPAPRRSAGRATRRPGGWCARSAGRSAPGRCRRRAARTSPPARRANRKFATAVSALPRWSAPVGEGAKRTRTPATVAGYGSHLGVPADPRGPSAGGEADDQLRGLERHVELRAVADAVELDPVGVWQPVVAVAGGRRRPREQPVLGAPDDPDRAVDPRRVEPASRCAGRTRSAAARPAAAAPPSGGRPGRRMCSKRVAMYSVARRRPSACDDRVDVRSAATSCSCIVVEESSVSPNDSSPRPSRRPAPAPRPTRARPRAASCSAT